MSSQLYCSVCQKSLNSVDQFSAHENGQSHLAKLKKLEEQNKAASNDDNNSSFFIRTCDYPSDRSSLKDGPTEPISSDASQASAPSATPLNNLNIPLSTGVGNELDTNRDNEFIFDKTTKKGWCKICNIILASKQTAMDHLRSDGHQRKRKNINEVLPSLGLTPSSPQSAFGLPDLSNDPESNPPSSPQNMNAQIYNSNIPPCDLCNATFNTEFDRLKHLGGQKHLKELRKKESLLSEIEKQKSVTSGSNETKKKEFFELSQQMFDKDKSYEEQTYKKGAFHTENGLNSQNQTQVKATPFGRPTAVVSPQNVTSPTSGSTAQDNGSALPCENNPEVPIPNVASQSMRTSDDYCEICRITLTSQDHADQHYAGRPHRRKEERLRGRPLDDDSKKVSVSVKVKLEM